MDFTHSRVSQSLSLVLVSGIYASASRLRFIGNSIWNSGLFGTGSGGALFCQSKDVELNRVYAARTTLSSMQTSGVAVYIDNSYVKITSSILEHNFGIGVDAW